MVIKADTCKVLIYLISLVTTSFSRSVEEKRKVRGDSPPENESNMNANIRRNARLRKEYLYAKSLEGKERKEFDKKRKIKDALESM